MTLFDTAFAQVIGAEGGYTNDPRDKGNWTGGEVGSGECRGTKYGISAAAYPNLDISTLSLDDAKLLYMNHYWTTVRGDQLPPFAAAFIFDMAVNMGVAEAALIAQRACGATADGLIGPETIVALASTDRKELMKNMTVQRILHYASLPKWPLYSHSWTDRTVNSLIESFGV
jgi:lysozyme family protein